MKKRSLIALFLIMIMCFSLSACGGGKGGSEIGTTYTSDYGIEFTLNYVEFTDAMDNWGGANDNYWKPLPEDASRNQIANAVKPISSDETICVISYTAKNTSKHDRVIDEVGTLDYDDGYTYSEGALSYRVSDTGVWSEIPGGLKLEKLKEDSYEFRAYIIVPKTLATETDKSLIYTLFGYDFDLR